MNSTTLSNASLIGNEIDAGTAAVIVATLAAVAFQQVSRQQRSKPLPPSVPEGMIESMKLFNDKKLFVPTVLKWARALNFPSAMSVPLSPAHNMVLVNEPGLVREILTDKLSAKPHMIYKFFLSVRGTSIINTFDNTAWKHVRKGVAPAFSSKHIDRMMRVCDEQVQRWTIGFLEPAIEAGDAFDPSHEMAKITISVVCRAAFDYDIPSDVAEVLLEDMETLALECYQRLMNPFREYFQSSKDAKKIAESLERIHALAQKLIDLHRASPNPTRGTVLDCIINNPHYEDDAARIREIDTFLFVGHDTTAYTLSWALYTLAKNPQEKKKLEEALLKLPLSDRASCPELQNVVRESMRLNPVSALGSARTAGRDFVTSDGYTIPKGTITFHSQMSMNRNPKVYGDDADAFRPDRWLTAKPQDLAAFSLGPRNCVGQALAKAEIHSVLSQLLIKYEFEVVRDHEPEYFLTYHPTGGLLKATKRV